MPFVGGVCIQSIEHPGCVWDVAFLPNGDLVTACSDGVARVWTREKNLYASAEEMEAFVSLVSSRKSAAFVSLPSSNFNLYGLASFVEFISRIGQN